MPDTSATSHEEPRISSGMAFSQVICGVSLLLRGLQAVTALVSVGAAGWSDAALWLGVWRAGAAILDFFDDVWRAAAIYTSVEPGYVNAQIGGAASRYRIASPHPNWSPWRGYTYWTWVRAAASSGAGPDFGPNLMDDD